MEIRDQGGPVIARKPDLEGQAGIAGAAGKEEVALLREQITALKADVAKLVPAEDNQDGGVARFELCPGLATRFCTR
jgi:hypothetical protein